MQRYWVFSPLTVELVDPAKRLYSTLRQWCVPTDQPRRPGPGGDLFSPSLTVELQGDLGPLEGRSPGPQGRMLRPLGEALTSVPTSPEAPDLAVVVLSPEVAVAVGTIVQTNVR